MKIIKTVQITALKRPPRRDSTGHRLLTNAERDRQTETVTLDLALAEHERDGKPAAIIGIAEHGQMTFVSYWADNVRSIPEHGWHLITGGSVFDDLHVEQAEMVRALTDLELIKPGETHCPRCAGRYGRLDVTCYPAGPLGVEFYCARLGEAINRDGTPITG